MEEIEQMHDDTIEPVDESAVEVTPAPVIPRKSMIQTFTENSRKIENKRKTNENIKALINPDVRKLEESVPEPTQIPDIEAGKFFEDLQELKELNKQRKIDRAEREKKNKANQSIKEAIARTKKGA